MPDSSRPTSSRFFQISKSYLTFDNSAKRVANHSGVKNLPIIFAYLTSKIFEIIMIEKNSNGKVGKDAFNQVDDGWISPIKFLDYMQWKINTITEKIITDIFNSFVQDKVMKSRSNRGIEFHFGSNLEFPTDSQIAEARMSNKYLMNIIDDLIVFLPRTFERGDPAHDRNIILYSPLWEAYYADPIHEAYKDEMLVQADNLISNFELTDSLSFVQIGTGAGFGTLEIIDLMINNLHSVEINVSYVEENNQLLNKAREHMAHHISDKIKLFNKKSITIRPNFESHSYTELEHMHTNKSNFVFAFQALQFVKESDLERFFEHISRILKLDGVFVLVQPTSYSKEFPYPLTLLYHVVKDFHGFPTVDLLKTITKKYFQKVQVSAMDTIWIMKLPKIN